MVAVEETSCAATFSGARIGAVMASSGVAAIIAVFALPPDASNDLRGALAVGGFGALDLRRRGRAVGADAHARGGCGGARW